MNVLLFSTSQLTRGGDHEILEVSYKMCFRTVFQTNEKRDTFIHRIPFTIDHGDPQALFNFPALLGCIGVPAERVTVSEKQVRVTRCCQFHLHDDA